MTNSGAVVKKNVFITIFDSVFKLVEWPVIGLIAFFQPFVIYLKYQSLGCYYLVWVLLYPFRMVFRFLGDKVFKIYRKKNKPMTTLAVDLPNEPVIDMSAKAAVNLDSGVQFVKPKQPQQTFTPKTDIVLGNKQDNKQVDNQVQGKMMSDADRQDLEDMANEKGTAVAIPIEAPKEPFTEKLNKYLKEKYEQSYFVRKQREREEMTRAGLLQTLPEESRSEKPVIYRYTALDSDGRREVNSFVAYSKMEVYSYLENEEYRVINIESSKFIDFMYGSGSVNGGKFKNKDLIFWLTQLSTYIKSGIPLTEAMRILSKQMSKDKRKKRAFTAILYSLTLGESFSEALAKQGNTFPSLLVNMIKAAEATGDLEATLDDMADYYNDVEETRKQMVSAMSYPTIIMIFAFGVIFFIMLYVVPQFAGIYDQVGADLNPLTLFILQTSAFLGEYYLVLLLSIVLIGLLISIFYKRIKAFRYFMQTLMMKLPVINNVIIYKEMAIFSKTFASLLKNNVFITDSIGILTNITTNEIYRDIMTQTILNIAKGDKISKSFKNHWAVPDVAYYMIVTGESTGELSEMMSRVAEYYQSSHKTIINTMKSFIEPAMIMFLAIVVGGIVIAVILPMFELYGQIQ